MKSVAEVLLVDDNPADIDLTSDVLAKSKRHFHVSAVNDGAEAISFLRQQGKYVEAPVPDLVVLDLNLPRKDGREVLSEVKADPNLARIPVVIFTTSQASSDISRSYELGANCYLRKPGNLPDFVAVVQSMADFWLGFASLPRKEKR
ncbi:MAG: response regulator [Acidobacteria bacterium]|nr:MAG: response regulator [Acidobacteriota bacterium]